MHGKLTATRIALTNRSSQSTNGTLVTGASASCGLLLRNLRPKFSARSLCWANGGSFHSLLASRSIAASAPTITSGAFQTSLGIARELVKLVMSGSVGHPWSVLMSGSVGRLFPVSAFALMSGLLGRGVSGFFADGVLFFALECHRNRARCSQARSRQNSPERRERSTSNKSARISLIRVLKAAIKKLAISKFRQKGIAI